MYVSIDSIIKKISVLKHVIKKLMHTLNFGILWFSNDETNLNVTILDYISIAHIWHF